MKAHALITTCLGLLSFSASSMDDGALKSELLAQPFEFPTVFEMNNEDRGILYVKVKNDPIKFKNDEEQRAHMRGASVPNMTKDFENKSDFYQFVLNRLLLDLKRLHPDSFTSFTGGSIDKDPAQCGVPSAFFENTEGVSEQIYASSEGWVKLTIAFLPNSVLKQMDGRRLADYESVSDVMKLITNRFWSTGQEEYDHLHPKKKFNDIPFGMYS